MAGKGPGSSEQSQTVLHRLARLYEGERWWLFDKSGEVRGLFLFDGGDDLAGLREDIGARATKDYRFSPVGMGTAVGHAPPPGGRPAPRPDCQVTVEERTHLFGFLKKG